MRVCCFLAALDGPTVFVYAQLTMSQMQLAGVCIFAVRADSPFRSSFPLDPALA